MHKQLKNSTVISDHYEKHQEKYERAQKTLIPFIIGGSFIVMILELFYNYIMFYKTMIAVAPGLSKFYYSWALLTYVLYFTGGILFITETEQFFYRPYFFWFIAFASFVLMITSFVVEAVANNYKNAFINTRTGDIYKEVQQKQWNTVTPIQSIQQRHLTCSI